MTATSPDGHRVLPAFGRGALVLCVALGAAGCQAPAAPTAPSAAAPQGSPVSGPTVPGAQPPVSAPVAGPQVAVGGSSTFPSAGLVTGALATSEPVADLETHCRDIAHHRFMGTTKLTQLEQAVQSLGALRTDPRAQAQLVEVSVDLGIERLRQAQYDGVLAEFERAWQIATANGALPDTLANLAYYRGVAKLRLGEVANCNTTQNRFMCLLNAGPQGAFTDQASVLAASDDFSYTLGVLPNHVGARWLLNVSAMLLGRYPNGVKEAWRIPPERFASAHQAPAFRNVARDLGVAAVGQAGSSMLEDFDNDGRLDFLVTRLNPCEPVRLYRNDGEGRLVERTKEAGLAGQLGAFVAQQTDYNNDGFIDLFMTRGGWQKDSGRFRRSLVKNNGDGTFADVSLAAGLAGPAYPTQASAWSDYDNDGDLDVYIGNETSDDGHIYPSQLFRNNGDGTFTDVAPSAGVVNGLMAKGVVWGDYDNDDDPDLYVSNLGPNRLYRNNGNGSFTDVAPDLRVTEPVTRSFPTWFFDYDNDGWLDLFVANYNALIEDIALDYMGRAPAADLTPRLYRNNRQGGFEDVTTAVGLGHAFLPMGANFGDIDNDGFLDFYLGTGDPSFWTVDPNVMYWNDRGRGFVDVTASAGVGHFTKGHGVSFGDLDNDGDQDIALEAGGFFAGDTQPDALFENPGAGNHWITLKLVGVRSNRAAIGARISLTVTEGAVDRLIHVEVTSGSSFGANSLQQEIGLGQAERIKTMRIHWPTSHSDQEFTDVAADQFLEIHEGATEYVVQDRPRISLTHRP